jgi:hypothetical protein
VYCILARNGIFWFELDCSHVIYVRVMHASGAWESQTSEPSEEPRASPSAATPLHSLPWACDVPHWYDIDPSLIVAVANFSKE